MSELLRKIEEIRAHAQNLEKQLSDPEVAGRAPRAAALGRELSQLRPLIAAAERYLRNRSARDEARELLDDADPEVAQLARAELKQLDAGMGELEAQIRLLLAPPDPDGERNAILELRAGTGGEEAALFAGDLLRMYGRYAELRGWQFEVLALTASGNGGTREAIAAISGPRVFSRLKYERGVHRVQRVPETEAQGRIHTSTATAAVLPEAREVEVHIDPRELRIDVMRASGPGGQSVNTTDSAVRITHLPSGLTVQCQDEKSQHKNRVRALKILRARLLEQERQRAAQERADARRSQVGSAGRSERIRTYNFPDSRVTDHRVGVTLHQLDRILEGELDPLLDAVHLRLDSR